MNVHCVRLLVSTAAKVATSACRVMANCWCCFCTCLFLCADLDTREFRSSCDSDWMCSPRTCSISRKHLASPEHKKYCQISEHSAVQRSHRICFCRVNTAGCLLSIRWCSGAGHSVGSSCTALSLGFSRYLGPGFAARCSSINPRYKCLRVPAPQWSCRTDARIRPSARTAP